MYTGRYRSLEDWRVPTCFVYKEGSLAGAKFKVYAAEDIYTADNQKDADGNRIKYDSSGKWLGQYETEDAAVEMLREMAKDNGGYSDEI